MLSSTMARISTQENPLMDLGMDKAG